jgi:hypothetical protein
MRVTGKGLGEFLIVALIAISTLELGMFFAIRWYARPDQLNGTFPMPSGYLLDGRYLAPISASCYVLRLTSDGCPYCRLDKSQYTRLFQRAKEAGCQTLLLAPKLGQMELNEDGLAIQLQFVDMKFGANLDPYLIPRTILLDQNGRLRWQQEGAMDDRTLRKALKVLETIH